MNKDLRNWLWALLLLAGCVAILFASQPAHSMSIQCIDGDTFAINGTYFRLSNIDTPEKGEPGYKEASEYTCNYLNQEKYKIITHGKDKYNRTLAEVGNLNTNLINLCLAKPFYGKTTSQVLRLYRDNCKYNPKGV